MKLTRPPQIRYASHVTKLLDNGGHAALEGPCGLGKSWGFLVPALARTVQRDTDGTPLNGRTIVATSARAHLGQLRTDLETHHPGGDWAALKGHGTYWCTNDDVLETLRHAYPAEARLLEHWRNTTVHGELRDEIPGLSPAVLDLVTCDSQECRAKDCLYRPARERAKHAKVILTTHAAAMTRHRYSNQSLTGVDALVVDECHLLEATATNERLPMPQVEDDCYLSGKPGKEKEDATRASNWWMGIQTRIHEARDSWINARDIFLPLVRKLNQNPEEYAEAVRRTRRADRKEVFPELEPEDISNCVKLADAIRAIAKMDRALAVAAKTHATGRGGKGNKHVTMALAEPHPEYLDIQDGQLCLRASDPMLEIKDLIEAYATTVLTSATISRAPAAVEITRYGTPYNLPEQITLQYLSSNVPARPTYGRDHGYEAAEQARAEAIAAGCRMLASKHKHIIVLVPAKIHANRLARLLPEAHVERQGYGSDRCADAIRETGGIMIAYTWHGFDLPGQDKVLLVERMPWAPPSRAWAALAAVTSVHTANQRARYDMIQRLHQGFGRAIRSAADRCIVIRGEDVMREYGDPRHLAPYES